jgi:hypothetical protein
MMLSFLRHISIRIWIALLLGGVVSLWVLPGLQARIGLGGNLPAAAAILLVFFVATGWVLKRWALGAVERLMAEAGAFERDGMYPEAENAWQRAAAVFDSFLMSPFVKRQRAGELGARMARFYLARSRRDPASQEFLVSYLNDNPQDEVVAEHWLHQIESSGGLREAHQELAARIGEAQPKNEYIQSTLAGFYMLLERTDFHALQTYRRVCDAGAPAAPEFIAELARLFVKEKRADEWALDIYLQALAQNGDRSGCLSGVAACVQWVPASGRNQPLLQKAQQHLAGIDANTLKTMRAGFNPPAPPKASRPVRRRIRPGAWLAAAARALVRYPGAPVRWTLALAKKTQQLIAHSRKARRVLTGILLTGLALAVAGLVVNTIGHLTVAETPAGEQAPPPAQAIVVTDPFTLQVAAYLNPENAKQYVQQLKDRGVDAYWSEAVSGQKKWYQVRVSHFATKQSARDYGEKLKSEGIIEDYYVANYRMQ